MSKAIINTKEELKNITVENSQNCELSESLRHQICFEICGVSPESMNNLDLFSDKDFQGKYEALENAEKIALLKPLWGEATLPAIQLKEIGYDALSKIEPSPYAGRGDMYRVYLSDTPLDKKGYSIGELEELGVQLGGSWTTEWKIAQQFEQSHTDWRYTTLWGDDLSQFVYIFTAFENEGKVLWTDDSPDKAELVISGFEKPWNMVSVQCIAKRSLEDAA